MSPFPYPFSVPSPFQCNLAENLKTPEQAGSLPKEEDGVADSTKEAQVSEDAEKKDEVTKAEDMDEKCEDDDGESKEAKTVKRGQSSEKEPVTPVSERPTRERKRTERYILHTPSRSSGSKAVSIEQGRGTRLKEIPNVAYKLSKRKSDDNLFLLHTILYGKKGKAQTLKKNIGRFSGFVWTEQEEEKQRARAKDKLEKFIKEKLIDFCDVLDIPINKNNVKKEELTVRLLEFLENPKATRDILLADSEKKTRKRKKSTTTNVTSGESSDVPAKRRRLAKSGKNLDQPTETEESGEADVGSKGTNNSHGEDEAAPSKETNNEKDTEAKEKKSSDKKSSSKRTKKEKPASEEEKSHKGSTKSGGKSSKQVAKSTSSSSKKQKVEKDDSSKEKGKKQTSKPHAKGSKDQGKTRKRGKREPSRKEMHVVVSKILKEVDFNTATLSDILRTLGSHFGVDLMHRKAEVKDIITDAIDEMSDIEKEENTEDEDDLT